MVEVNGLKWYEDRDFLKNLDIYLDAMSDNDDLVIVFDGLERSGKSFRIRQVAKYCAWRLGTEFTDKNVHFELQSYLDFSIESPHYTVCVLDEGRNVLNKKNSMSKVNKKFTNYISECAKKRQVHIIAAPAFHDLDKYICDWRMKFLIHMHKWYDEDKNRYSGYKLARGKYTMYMNDNYLKTSYKFPYSYPKRWETIGRFNNIEVFTPEELERYEEQKDVNMEKKYHSKSEEEQLNKREQMWLERSIKVINGHLQRGVPEHSIKDMLGFSNDNWNVFKHRHKDKLQLQNN